MLKNPLLKSEAGPNRAIAKRQEGKVTAQKERVGKDLMNARVTKRNFVLIFLLPFLASGCMTLVRHNIPKTTHAAKTIPEERKAEMTYSLAVENPTYMSDWVAREAVISAGIRKYFMVSGYFKSVRETKEPGSFHIAFRVKMIPNPNEIAYAYLAGATLMAIPVWYSHDVELSADVIESWQKADSFFDRESVTRVWWLPFLPVGPFSTFGTAAKEIQRNYFGQILSRLEDKKILPVRQQLQSVAKENAGEAGESETASFPSKYDNILNCVVVIATSRGLGSGFLVSRNGLVITNAHVVGDETTVSVKMRDGKSLMGVVQERDSGRDLALVRLQGGSFDWLALGNRTEIDLGSEVLAVGAPKSLGWSISKGVVSALRTENGMTLIQTDAAVNSGNSGGPLINPQTGRVLGVNAFGFRKDLAEGLNFAIAAEEITKSFPDVANVIDK